jgi:hypothetical protein
MNVCIHLSLCNILLRQKWWKDLVLSQTAMQTQHKPRLEGAQVKYLSLKTPLRPRLWAAQVKCYSTVVKSPVRSRDVIFRPFRGNPPINSILEKIKTSGCDLKWQKMIFLQVGWGIFLPFRLVFLWFPRNSITSLLEAAQVKCLSLQTYLLPKLHAARVKMSDKLNFGQRISQIHLQNFCYWLDCTKCIWLIVWWMPGGHLLIGYLLRIWQRLHNAEIHSPFLARRDDCPESYCHDPGVGVTPQGKNFNLGYIFWTIRDRMLIFHI